MKIEIGPNLSNILEFALVAFIVGLIIYSAIKND